MQNWYYLLLSVSSQSIILFKLDVKNNSWKISPKNIFSLCFRHDKQSTEKHFFILFQKILKSFFRKKKWRNGKIISLNYFLTLFQTWKNKKIPKILYRIFFFFFKFFSDMTKEILKKFTLNIFFPLCYRYDKKKKKTLKIFFLQIFFQFFFSEMEKVFPEFFSLCFRDEKQNLSRKTYLEKTILKINFLKCFFQTWKIVSWNIFFILFQTLKKKNMTWQKKFSRDFVDMTQSILEIFSPEFSFSGTSFFILFQTWKIIFLKLLIFLKNIFWDMAKDSPENIFYCVSDMTENFLKIFF